MKVQCPNCKRKDFVTSETYRPGITPNGSMVRCLLPWNIDWLTASTTLVAEMTCPNCLAQLAPGGRLTVIPDPETDHIHPIEKELEPESLLIIPKSDQAGQPDNGSSFICSICDREFKTKAARNGHQQSHAKGGKT